MIVSLLVVDNELKLLRGLLETCFTPEEAQCFRFLIKETVFWNPLWNPAQNYEKACKAVPRSLLKGCSPVHHAVLCLL